MSYKIAVASNDGKAINQHFGKATQFLIFQVDEGGFKFLELIKFDSFCNYGEHDENRLLVATERLSGCRAVLVSQIGSGAVEALRSKEIEAFDIGGFIEDALKKLIKYYSKIDRNKLKSIF